MADLSQYSDAEIMQAAGVSPAANVSNAILGQESGNNANIGNSIDGAVGMGQIMPATFKQYAQAGEDISNPADNLAVHKRIIEDLSNRSGGDPARIAVGYFSGPGNIAPPDSPTPYKHDAADGNGKRVSAYVSDVLGRMGNAIIPAASAESASAESAPAQSSKPTDLSTYSDAEIAQAAGIPASKDSGSFLGEMKDNAVNAVQNAKDLVRGNFAGGGGTISSPKTETLADKLFPEGTGGDGIANAGGDLLYNITRNTSPSDYANALLEKFGQTPAGKAVGVIGGLNPAYNAAGTAINRYVNPAISKMTGIDPATLSVGELALPALGLKSGAAKISDPALTAAKATIEAVRPEAPEPPLPSMMATDSGKPLVVGPKAYGQGAQDLGTFINADGIDLAKVASDLEAAQRVDPNARAIDVMAKDEGGIPGAPNILGLAKSIAQSPGQGRSLAAEMVSRGFSATKDIGGDFEGALKGSDYSAIGKDAIKQKEGSGQFYDEAFSHPGNQNIESPVINRILKTDAGTAAMKYAAGRMNDDMSLMVKPDPALAEQAKLVGSYAKGGIGKGLKLQSYQYIKEGFDEQIAKARNAGEMGSARSIGRQKNTLLSQLDDLDATKSKDNPGAYSVARKTYSTAARVQDATTQGRDFMKMDPEDISSFFKDDSISNPEKQAFASAAGRAFQDRLDNVRDGSNPVETVWKEGLRKRLEAMMPPEVFARLSQSMDLHQVKARVNKIVQGSPTFANAKFSETPVTSMLGNAIRTAADPLMQVGNILGGIADKALVKHAKAMSQDAKTVAMRYLTTKDPAVIRDLAMRLNKGKP